MPLTTAATGVEEHNLSKIAARAKCATVTMMLAERIVRKDRSVDNEPLVVTNAMNVWQTLEFISGANLRKRYHYEGYNDTENAVRTLTPSWRRDSFVDKKEEGPLTPRPEVLQENTVLNNCVEATTVGVVNVVLNSSVEDVVPPLPVTPLLEVKPKVVVQKKKVKAVTTKHGKKKKAPAIEFDPVFKMSPFQYTDIIKCK